MPEKNSQQRLGQLAVQRGLLSIEQLREAIQEYRARRAAGSRLPLGEVLVELEYLTRRQLDGLLKSQGGRKAPSAALPGFELIRKLGEGGMGATYLARQVSMDRLVALKVLRKNLSRDKIFVERFHREARLAGQLDHVNIVKAIDVGEGAGFHYLVMEYVEGKSALDLIPEGGAMEELEALQIVLQIARALAYAGERNIIHRDVKPDNILVTADRVAKLCDFGLARHTGQETRLTQTGVAMGTPHYVSPEQARGDGELDSRTDIYSLGATLYHMVTGRTPFDGASAVIVMTKHLSEQVPWPREVNPALSENICRLIERMMAKAPEDRYPTPAALVADVELVISGRAPAGGVQAIGMSSIARAGDITVEPAEPQPQPGRFRSTRVAGLDDTFGAGQLEPLPARRLSPLPLSALVVGVLLAGGLLLWVLRAPEDGTGKRNPAADRRTRRQAVPEGRSASAKDTGKQDFESMLEYARKWWAEHPGDYDQAVANYRKVEAAAKGTRWQLAAAAEFHEIQKQRRAALEAAFRTINERIDKLVDSGDFDAALDELHEASSSGTDRGLRERIRQKEQSVTSRARQKIVPVLREARQLYREGRLEDGLKRLEALQNVKCRSFQAQVASLRGAIERQQLQVTRLREQRTRAAAEKRLDAILREFDSLVSAGKRAEAGRYLTAEKLKSEPRIHELIAADLRLMEAALSAMPGIEEARKRALKSTAGRRMKLRTRDGLSYEGRISRCDPEKRFIEISREYKIMGQRKSRVYRLKFEDLAEGTIDGLARVPVAGRPGAQLAAAVMGIAAGKFDAARSHLESLRDCQPRRYYWRKVQLVDRSAAEDHARNSWEADVTPLATDGLSPPGARRLQAALESWLRNHEDTDCAKGRRAQIKSLRMRIAAALKPPRPTPPGPRRPEPGPAAHSAFTASWQQVPLAGESPSTRYVRPWNLAYDAKRGRVLLFGGYAGAGCYLNDLWSLDLKARRWHCLQSHSTGDGVGETRPNPRPGNYRRHLVHDPVNDIYWVGFQWAYSPRAGVWKKRKEGPSGLGAIDTRWWSRCGWACDSVQGRFLGVSYAGCPYSFDLKTGRAERLSAVTPRSDYAIGGLAYDPRHRVFVFVARRGREVQTWIADQTGRKWQQSPGETQPPALFSQCLIWHNGIGALVLCGDAPGVVSSGGLSRLWVFEPAAQRWTEVRTGGVRPSCRYGASIYDSRNNRVVLLDRSRRLWALDLRCRTASGTGGD
jgi:serine/threonine-protein kinase